MNPDRWREVKQVLDGALERNNQERSSYLDAVCVADPELRQEVESLLLHHERAGTQFLDTPAVDFREKAPSHTASAQRTGTRLGAYDLLEEIGQGGMGEVYRAVRADGQFTKQVAVKLVRGGHDTAFVLEKFRQERQILATLDHPNIARLLDGGTTEDGIPYLVMELVEGVPIDQYCDVHAISISGRLKLFLEVSAAVHYAHQRLVIHRDIKPSNIMVTEDGKPKLLDFGIAKILDPANNPETTLLRPMTPEYASPEQVRGEPVTTSTDVYSLGVVLYRLLTGRPPYTPQTQASHELARLICEVEPEKPSTVFSKVRPDQTQVAPQVVSRAREASPAKLRRQLRGDLDNIVLKALRKEPERRFISVEQFAEDIRRHLEGLPVTARKDSWSYRANKFVHRHAWAVTSAAFVAILALVGVLLIVREAHIAQVNGRRAERRFKDVRKLANSLMFEVHDSIKDLPGSTPARKLLVSRALEYLDSLSQEAKGDPSLLRELAAAYQRIGDVQGQPRQANLGDQAGAVASYRKAIAIQESLLASDPGNMELRREMVPNYGRLSDLLRDMGDRAGCIENSRKEMETAEAVYKSNPADSAGRLLFASYRMDYGYKQATVADDHDAGLENLQQGSALLEQIVSENPSDRWARRVLGLSYSRTAEILRVNKADRPRALELYQKALAIKQRLISEQPNNTDYQRLAAYDQFNISHLMAELDDPNGALTLGREALASFQQLAAADPSSPLYQEDIVEVRGDIGETLVKLGKFDEAFHEIQGSLSMAEKMPGAQDPQQPVGFIVLRDQFRMGQAYTHLALSQVGEKKANQCRQAESWFKRCQPAFQALQDHGSFKEEAAAYIRDIERLQSSCSSTAVH